MKFLLFLTVLSTTVAFGQSRGEFLKLSNEEKMSFLEKKAVEVDDQKALEAFSKKNAALVKKIQASADDYATPWGDGVLEGPYDLTGEPTAELASLHLVGNTVYAVSIVVRAPAVMTETEDCEYSDESDEWAGDCAEGAISETIILDHTGEYIDTTSYADFED